jgi:hypothetical protein
LVKSVLAGIACASLLAGCGGSGPAKPAGPRSTLDHVDNIRRTPNRYELLFDVPDYPYTSKNACGTRYVPRMRVEGGVWTLTVRAYVYQGPPVDYGCTAPAYDLVQLVRLDRPYRGQKIVDQTGRVLPVIGELDPAKLGSRARVTHDKHDTPITALPGLVPAAG